MAEFHDYRQCGSDVELYDITAHFSASDTIVVWLSEEVFIKLTASEARLLSSALVEAIDDFKEYAAYL